MKPPNNELSGQKLYCSAKQLSRANSISQLTSSIPNACWTQLGRVEALTSLRVLMHLYAQLARYPTYSFLVPDYP